MLLRWIGIARRRPSLNYISREEARVAMGVELNIKITSPLTDDDRDLIRGVSILVIAIANRELGDQGLTGPEDVQEGDLAGDPNATDLCGASTIDGGCTRPTGHLGAHRAERIAALN